jgi:hypothetical protein
MHSGNNFVYWDFFRLRDGIVVLSYSNDNRSNCTVQQFPLARDQIARANASRWVSILPGSAINGMLTFRLRTDPISHRARQRDFPT